MSRLGNGRDELAQELHVTQDVLDDVLELTADYMFARYPDVADHVPYEEYDEDIAREKANRAQHVFERLKERLQGLEDDEEHAEEEWEEEDEEHEANE